MRAYEFITEVRIKPTGNDSPQAWIDYFLTSTHPNLRGKDADTLKRMALAARSRAVNNPPKPKARPTTAKPNVRYWWQDKDLDEAETVNNHLYVENTPEGVILYAEDIEVAYVDQEGADVAEGLFNFSYNITKDKVVEIDAEDEIRGGDHDEYAYYKDEQGIDNSIAEIVSNFKRQYGTTWDEISHELHGGLEIEPVGEAVDSQPDLRQVLKDFLPIVVKELKLKSLPKIQFVSYVPREDQPTFGRFKNEKQSIKVGIEDRHPMDIMRTLAHELVHYKQLLQNELGKYSGITGSPDENEANRRAGVIMRHFDKQYPHYFKEPSVDQKPDR